MQRTTTRWIIVLVIVIIAFTYFLLFSGSDEVQPPKITESATSENQIKSTEAESKQKSKTIALEQIEKHCDENKLQAIRKFARPKWLAFKKDIYDEGIRYPVLQLSISENEPIEGSFILKQQYVVNKQLKPEPINTQIFVDAQEKIFGLLLTNGIQGVISAVDNGELPEEVLTQAGSMMFQGTINISSKTKSTKILPNEDEIMTLVDYGLTIEVNDYNFATKNNMPINFLQLLVKFGPTPDAENYQHEIIPIDIAAKKGDLELVDFWYQSGLIYSNKLIGGDFSDSLVLSAVSVEQLNQYWDFLSGWSHFPKDPTTAKNILFKRNWPIRYDIEEYLQNLIKKKPPSAKLVGSDEMLYQKAKSEISRINQKIILQFPDYVTCKSRQTVKKYPLSKNTVFHQIQSGKNLKDILKILSMDSPSLVDRFRRKLNNGDYKPFLLPLKSSPLDQYSEEMQQAFGMLLLNDWDGISESINNRKFSDTTKFLLLSDSKNYKLPEKIKLAIINQIHTIPKASIKQIPSTLNIQQLQNLELSSEILNQTDGLGKNLFYYAAKRNKSDLMQWLAQKNVNMDPDRYGTDAMDVVLKYNTHPDSLQTLCDLGFPIKNKHKKTFNQIKKEDPNEANEILERCPGFSD